MHKAVFAVYCSLALASCAGRAPQPERLSILLWSACISDQTNYLARTAGTPSEIADAVIDRCAQEQSRFTAGALGADDQRVATVANVQQSFRQQSIALVLEIRAAAANVRKGPF